MSRTRLYRIVTLACAAGYGWLAILISKGSAVQETSVCLIKTMTDVPCPSCGTSRSILSILEGHFVEALQWNPVGYVVAALMIISPVWILIDVLFSKDSFLRFYRKAESTLRNKWIAWPMIALFTANWIWNIIKAL